MAKQLSMEDLIKKYKYLKCLRDADGRVKPDECSLNKPDQTIVNHSKSSPEPRNNNDKSKHSSSALLSDEKADDTCKVCMDAQANCAFIECGHVATCLNCATLLTKCPICRETIKKVLRIYKS